MPRLCTVCIHPQRVYIDVALFLHQKSYRDIARHYNLGRESSAIDVLWRHEHTHLEMSKEAASIVRAIEDYWRDPRQSNAPVMDALTQVAYTISTALVCGLLSPSAIHALRKALACYDQHSTREEIPH